MTDLRLLLPRSWYAFMARHPQPRPIQLEGVPAVLGGGGVLLASATASGKTETYAAPLVERWHDDMRAGRLRVVVVSPTRALVNDLARRLEGPLQRLGIGLQRRTGDHPKPLEGGRFGILVTTPESLDSLLARHARALGPVRAVVLDELHVLEGTARGDQVRVLLERLARVTSALEGVAPQRVAATATLDRVEEVARLWLGSEARVIQVASARELRLSLALATDPEALGARIGEAARAWGCRKVLAFVPSRALAEDLAWRGRGQPPFQSSVWVHHASLSREERERVEQVFLTAPAALCFATPTMEVGIDIGDVDLVALVGPPPDVSSFLQRIGRGNRRTGACQVLGLYAGPGERARFEHLEACARRGLLLAPRAPFRASVLVQQAFSLLHQNPERCLSAQALSDRLPPDVRPRFPASRVEGLLEGLAGAGWLARGAGGRYRAGESLERAFQRGRIHHNLDSDGAREDRVAVVEDHTGRVVGHLSRDASGKLPEDLQLGGQRRRVVADHGREIRVRGDGGGGPGEGPARFSGRGSPQVSLPLAMSLAAHLGVEAGKIPEARTRTLKIRGLFCGSTLAALQAEALRPLGGGANPFVAWIPAEHGWPRALTAARIQARLARSGRARFQRAGLGPWARLLPPEWWAEELNGQIDVEQAAALFGGEAERAPGELAAILVDLVPARVREGG